MATVIRPLREGERGLFIPLREVIEPEASEIIMAVAEFVATLVSRGVQEQQGEVLVAISDKLRVASPYTTIETE